jgi:hypothetical protein
MNGNVSVHFGPDAGISLQVLGEEEHGPVELRNYAESLLRAGVECSEKPECSKKPEADSGVDFATLETSGAVRFFSNGSRITTAAGLELIADGLRETLRRHVETPSGSPADH